MGGVHSVNDLLGRRARRDLEEQVLGRLDAVERLHHRERHGHRVGGEVAVIPDALHGHEPVARWRVQSEAGTRTQTQASSQPGSDQDFAALEPGPVLRPSEHGERKTPLVLEGLDPDELPGLVAGEEIGVAVDALNSRDPGQLTGEGG